MATAYDKAAYYELAFSFFSQKKQVTNLEALFRKFGKRKLARVLDIACGPSPQLLEFASRGYEAIGLDLNLNMLRHLSQRAKERDVQIETVKADYTNFRLRKKADFALIMMGSLIVGSNEAFLSHLDSVSRSLNSGGIYFIQNWHVDSAPATGSWVTKKGGVTIKTTYESRELNPVTQEWEERLVQDVDDHGKKMRFVHERPFKRIYPQELKALVALNGKFRFAGWFEGTTEKWFFDRPLEKSKRRSDTHLNGIVLVRA